MIFLIKAEIGRLEYLNPIQTGGEAFEACADFELLLRF